MDPPIKGLFRPALTKTERKVNVAKVLDFLKNKEKFNKRHLWSGKDICAGDPTTIWEILADIKKYYSLRIEKPKKKAQNPSIAEEPVKYFGVSPQKDESKAVFDNMRKTNLQGFKDVNRKKQAFSRSKSKKKLIVFDKEPSSTDKEDFSLEMKNKMFNFNLNSAGISRKIDFKQHEIAEFRDSTVLAQFLNKLTGKSTLKEENISKGQIIGNFNASLNLLKNKLRHSDELDTLTVNDLCEGRGESVRILMKVIVENKHKLKGI